MPEDYRKGARPAQGGRRPAPAAPPQGGSPRGHHRGRLPTQTHAGDAVVVNAYSERWLRQGFPWVYREEVTARTGALVPGRVVTIRARDGAALGVGVWDDGKVEVRRFREDEGPIDADLLRDRLREARARRALPPQTDAWRLIHGENDGLPGIRVDIWGDAAVLTLDSPSLQGLVEPLLDVLREEREVASAWLYWRPPEGEDDRFRGLTAGRIWGPDPSGDLTVQELGLRFKVRPAAGHDIGLFCDMRELRAWMRPHWAGRRVLNLFCFTGAFSVAAAAGGAFEVVSVDLSPHYLERAKANFRANDLDPGAHGFLEEDAFKALDRLRRQGEMFDVIIADPPSFSHSAAGAWSVERDYKRLVSACLRVLSPGGWLIAATNSGNVSPKDFRGYLVDGAHKAGRSLRLIHEGSPPLDFPAALDFPPSRYLKCWVLQA